MDFGKDRGSQTLSVLSSSCMPGRRGSLSAQSALIKHKELMLRLLEAAKLPAKLAVIYARVTEREKNGRPRKRES